MKIINGIGVLLGVVFIALFLLTALLDLSVGCPPPPFAHRCLMKQAGVLPPYNQLDYND